MFLNELIDASQPVASLRGGHRSPWTKVVDEEGRPTMPLLLVDWAEIEGPLLLASDLAKREGVVPEEGLGPRRGWHPCRVLPLGPGVGRSIRRKSSPILR